MTALTIPALAVAAESSHGEYRDDFNPVGYDGDDGSLEWASPWYEQGDDDNASTGSIHVDDGDCFGNQCLHIEGGGLLGSMYVKRYANTKIFRTADLGFDISIQNASLAGGAVLQVQVSTDEGLKWSTLPQGIFLIAGFNGQRLYKSIPLNEHLSEGFAVRFLMSDLVGLETFDVYIDNVEIKGEFAGGGGSSTTSSTTQPTTTTTKATTTTSQPKTTTTSSVEETTTTTGATTSTTKSEETTTTSIGTVGGLPPPGVPPFDSGLRDPGSGLMADYGGGMMGDMDMEEVEVLGAELTADFSLAVEAFESAKFWIAGLALVIAAAIIGGMDSRRFRRQ